MKGSVTDYEVVRKLGKGGQASVQLWRSKKGMTLVAVKIFKDPDPACSDKFIDEGRMLKDLDHPCLVKGFGYLLPQKKGDAAHLFMEYVDGGALDTSSLDATGKALILLSIAKGMEYLHEHGIAHLDIKPSNSGDEVWDGQAF
jgi:serine/threonine protein kinase